MSQRYYLTAFITYRNKTIAATNLPGSLLSKSGRRYSHVHHAEARAIRKALANGFNLREVSILVTRDLPSGGTGMAKPCGRCWRLMKQLGVDMRRVRWTT